MGVPQTEEEEGRRNRDAAAAATDEEEARQNRDAAPAATADKAGPLTFQSADILDDGSQEGEERHVRADDSSMEYAGDLNVSDDEATLEEEEVSSHLPPVQDLSVVPHVTCQRQNELCI